MKQKPPDSGSLTHDLKDQQVLKIVAHGAHQIVLQFSGGTSLIIDWCPDGLLTRVMNADRINTSDTSPHPTRRQLEYLTFIQKYITRFGKSPAESDIERHFLVSAPSVNQMMQMLERRGFIARQPGVPRSARILFDLGAHTSLGTSK